MDELSQKEILEILNEGFFSTIGKRIGKGVVGAMAGGAKALGGAAKLLAPQTSGAVSNLAGYAKGIGQSAKGGYQAAGKAPGGIKKAAKAVFTTDDKELQDKITKALEDRGYVLDPSKEVTKTQNGRFYIATGNKIAGVNPQTGEYTLLPLSPQNLPVQFRLDVQNPTRALPIKP